MNGPGDVIWWRVGKGGVPEAIDTLTGEVYTFGHKAIDERERVVKKGYRERVAHEICRRIAEGDKLSHILREEGYPDYGTWQLWLRWQPELLEFYQMSLRQRAIHYRDLAVTVAEEVQTKDDVPVAEFKAKTFLRSAAYDDPATFNPSSKQSIDVSATVATTFVIETGIRRAGDEGFIKDVSQQLMEEESNAKRNGIPEERIEEVREEGFEEKRQEESQEKVVRQSREDNNDTPFD